MEIDKNKLYSIGQVSQLCNISRKTLRYYESIGLILPDKIGENSYRYYSRDTLLAVPVIRYYKQMGFKLEELKELLYSTKIHTLSFEFEEKLNEHKALEVELCRMKNFIQDWHDLIKEAQIIIEQDVREISLKYMEERSYCAMDYVFDYDYKEATINIEFTNFISNIGNAITGPVMISYPSFKEKMNGQAKQVQVIQESIMTPPEDHSYVMPAGMYLSVYHIGDLNTINETYERIVQWSHTNTYQLKNEVIERYVIDYWTTNNTDYHVTELLIAVARKN